MICSSSPSCTLTSAKCKWWMKQEDRVDISTRQSDTQPRWKGFTLTVLQGAWTVYLQLLSGFLFHFSETRLWETVLLPLACAQEKDTEERFLFEMSNFLPLLIKKKYPDTQKTPRCATWPEGTEQTGWWWLSTILDIRITPSTSVETMLTVMTKELGNTWNDLQVLTMQCCNLFFENGLGEREKKQLMWWLNRMISHTGSDGINTRGSTGTEVWGKSPNEKHTLQRHD